MAFPQVAASNGGSNASFTTDHTVNLPSNIVAGNLLIVIFACAYARTATYPANWVQLSRTTDNSNVTLFTHYKIADGTEGATITVTLNSGSRTAHISHRITGHLDVPEAPTGAIGSSTAPNPPDKTPSWGAKDTLWLACCGYLGGLTSISAYPTNYTNGLNYKANDTSGGAVGDARRELNAVSENPGTFTLDSSRAWAAQTVAIQPAAAAQTLYPSGFAQAQAVGTPKLTIQLHPAGIEQSIAIGAPKLTLIIYPPGIEQLLGIGTPLITVVPLPLPPTRKVLITHPALKSVTVVKDGAIQVVYDNLSNLDELRIEDAIELPVAPPARLLVKTLSGEVWTFDIPP